MFNNLVSDQSEPPRLRDKQPAIRLVCFVCVVALFLTGGTPIVAAEEPVLSPTLREIAEAGVFRIGYRRVARPLSFLPPLQTRPTGYSIALCERVFADIKKKISKARGQEIKDEFIPVDASDRFCKLRDKSIDILCGMTSKTLSREEDFEFSLPIFVTGGVFLSRKKDIIDDISDLRSKKVAVIQKTSTEKVLSAKMKRAGIPAENIVLVKNIDEGVRRVADPVTKADHVDAFATDQVPLLANVNRRNDADHLHISSRFLSFELYALAINKERRDLRLLTDRVLAEYYRTQQIHHLVEKWFRDLGGRVPGKLHIFFDLNAIPE